MEICNNCRQTIEQKVLNIKPLKIVKYKDSFLAMPEEVVVLMSMTSDFGIPIMFYHLKNMGTIVEVFF